MKEYSLTAVLRDNEGGEWSADAGITAVSDEAAGREARAWGRAVAREQGARLVDAWACDAAGQTYPR